MMDFTIIEIDPGFIKFIGWLVLVHVRLEEASVEYLCLILDDILRWSCKRSS